MPITLAKPPIHPINIHNLNFERLFARSQVFTRKSWYYSQRYQTIEYIALWIERTNTIRSQTVRFWSKWIVGKTVRIKRFHGQNRWNVPFFRTRMLRSRRRKILGKVSWHMGVRSNALLFDFQRATILGLRKLWKRVQYNRVHSKNRYTNSTRFQINTTSKWFLKRLGIQPTGHFRLIDRFAADHAQQRSFKKSNDRYFDEFRPFEQIMTFNKKSGF